MREFKTIKFPQVRTAQAKILAFMNVKGDWQDAWSEERLQKPSVDNCKKEVRVIAVSLSHETYRFIADTAAKNRNSISITASIMLDMLAHSTDETEKQIDNRLLLPMPKEPSLSHVQMKCKDCGDTEPANFYSYNWRLCKSCYRERQRLRKKQKELDAVYTLSNKR